MKFGPKQFNRCRVIEDPFLLANEVCFAANSGLRYKSFSDFNLNLTALNDFVEAAKKELPHDEQGDKYWELYLSENYFRQYNYLHQNRKDTYCLLVA